MADKFLMIENDGTASAAIKRKTADQVKAITDLKTQFDETTEHYGKNLINQAELLTIPGWEETDGVYYGTLRNIADAKISTVNGGFTVYAPFKANTRYTLGMKVRCTGSTSSGDGLRVNFNYTNGTQATYNIPNSTTEEWDFAYNPAASERTLDSISFGVNSGYDNVWYIRELYLTEYTNEHEYAPFQISAIDLKARGDIMALSASVESYYNFRSGYYDLHGSTVDVTSPASNANYRCIVIPCEEGDRFLPLVYAYGSASRRWGFVGENGRILSVEDQIAAATSLINDGTIITAPANARYLVCNHRLYNYGGDPLTFQPVVYKLSKYDAINDISTELGILPKFTKGWKTKVIGIWDKYIAVYEDNTIKISTDFGDSFPYSIDVSSIGAIKHCRFYTDGTLAVFTTNKAYYSANYTTLIEASLYNSDGSAFSSDTEYNFDVAGESKTRKIVNGVDICVFGNYTLSDATTREMIWYSVDGGKSYKIAYEFNIEGHYNARHTHMVYYYEPEDTFIALMGDKLADQCRVLGFTYNTQNDTWTVVSLSGEQSSRNYKWSYIDAWDGYLYYAHDVAPGSIKRCKYADIGDLSKHEIVLDEIPNDVTVAAIGPAGDMIVIQSIFRSLGGGTSEATLSAAECARKVYYSSDRKSFAEIVIPPITFNRLYTIPFWYQPVQNHLISGTWWDAQDSKLPSIYIDDIVRASGFPKAFLPL